MTTSEILNNIDIQVEYTLVYYDSEKEQRFKLDECPFTQSIEIRYMYIENGTVFFELDEWHLFSDERTKNRNIDFLNPQKI